MRWLVISLFVAALLACENPNNSEDISSTTPTETELAGEQWQPEPMHVYIMDDTLPQSEEAILYEYMGEDAEEYNWILTRAHVICTSHNQDYPEEPWDCIGGGS